MTDETSRAFTTRQRRRQSGGVVIGVLALIVILAGAGGWNYQRNAELEKKRQSRGKFSGYTIEGLEQLAAAYGGEVKTLKKQHSDVRKTRVEVRQTGTVDGNVREFDRAADASKRIREVGSEVAKNKSRLKEVQGELRRRGKRKEGWELHVERLTAMN